MSYRLAAIATSCLFASGAWAQLTDTDSVREAMFSAADQIYKSVSGGPGPLETTLGFDRGANLRYSLDDAERQNWQFWPTARIGLPLEYMTANQRKLTHALLSSALSAPGYLKVVHIMQLEQVLEALDEAGFPRAVDHYRLVFFGRPSETEPWAWRFEGHHVSLSVTVSPNGVAVTPSFLGSNPAEVVAGPLAGFRVHGALEDLARELVRSLPEGQQSQAIVSDRAPGEIFAGNLRKERAEWDAWIETLEPVGVPVRSLNEVQRHWVDRIIGEVVGNYQPEVQAAYADTVDLDQLRFAWMGRTERGQPHYFRLQGPEFLFEYDNVQNGGNHVHSVWRSASNDFGRDLLGEHYRTSHLR